jgi:hypothetical protein
MMPTTGNAAPAQPASSVPASAPALHAVQVSLDRRDNGGDTSREYDR